MSPIPLARILIVDDEAANMQALCDTPRDRGYQGKYLYGPVGPLPVEEAA